MPGPGISPRIRRAIDRWIPLEKRASEAADTLADEEEGEPSDPALGEAIDAERAARTELANLLRRVASVPVYRGKVYIVEGTNRIRTQDAMTLD